MKIYSQYGDPAVHRFNMKLFLLAGIHFTNNEIPHAVQRMHRALRGSLLTTRLELLQISAGQAPKTR